MVFNIIIGRLSASNETDILNYLDKVKQVEQNTVEDCNYINEGRWKHSIINIVGGGSAEQATIFADRLSTQANIAKNGVLTANSSFLFKSNGFQNNANYCGIGISPRECFGQVINTGVQLVNFLGHSNNLNFEVDIGKPTDYSYNNHYPIMISQASFTGDVYKSFSSDDRLSMPEDWLKASKAGATAFLGFIYIREMRYGADFIDEVFAQIFTKKIGATLGEQVNAAMHQHYNVNNLETIHTVNQFVFAGDPALRYATNTKPELAIIEEQVEVSVDQFNDVSYAIQIAFNFDRLNIPADEPVAYTIILQGTNEEIVAEGALKDGEVVNFKREFIISPNEQQQFIIQLDADNKYDEICEENNKLIIAVDEFLINDVVDFVDQQFLIQNHPNPFNEQTVFSITLPKTPQTPNLVGLDEELYLSIANLNGQVVNRIILNQTETQQQIIWDGTNNDRKQLPAGVYWYQLKSEGDQVISAPMKLVLVK